MNEYQALSHLQLPLYLPAPDLRILILILLILVFLLVPLRCRVLLDEDLLRFLHNFFVQGRFRIILFNLLLFLLLLSLLLRGGLGLHRLGRGGQPLDTSQGFVVTAEE